MDILNFEIDHLGYAVFDIEKSLKLFLDLGYETLADVIDDGPRHVKIAFVKLGDMSIELISPMTEKSPVMGYLKKNGNTPYHICYRVENLEMAIARLRELHFKVIEKANSAMALGKRRIAFLYHVDYGLLELLEKHINTK